jgi:hypothetical protein
VVSRRAAGPGTDVVEVGEAGGHGRAIRPRPRTATEVMRTSVARR